MGQPISFTMDQNSFLTLQILPHPQNSQNTLHTKLIFLNFTRQLTLATIISLCHTAPYLSRTRERLSSIIIPDIFYKYGTNSHKWCIKKNCMRSHQLGLLLIILQYISLIRRIKIKMSSATIQCFCTNRIAWLNQT